MIKTEIKKLEIQIKGLELEKNRLTRAYGKGELAKHPFEKIRDLNNQILKLGSELSNLRRLDPDKYDTRSSSMPNPVELMFTWCDVFSLILAISWVSMAFSALIWGENIWFATIGTGIIILFLGIPGMLMKNLLESTQERLGSVLPTYYCSGTLFSGGIRQALQRIWQNFTWFGLFTVFFVAVVLIGDVGCIFNPNAGNMSIIGVLFLSLGGFFVIGTRVVVDVFRETRKARQVF